MTLYSVPNAYYRVSLKGLILDGQGRFLLLKEANGYWAVPGGGLDHGESLDEGLRREFFEEMGVQIEIISSQPRYVNITDQIDPRTLQVTDPKIDLVFEIKLLSDAIKYSDECVEVKYFTPDEALALTRCYPGVQVLAKAYKSAKK